MNKLNKLKENNNELEKKIKYQIINAHHISIGQHKATMNKKILKKKLNIKIKLLIIQ